MENLFGFSKKIFFLDTSFPCFFFPISLNEKSFQKKQHKESYRKRFDRTDRLLMKTSSNPNINRRTFLKGFLGSFLVLNLGESKKKTFSDEELNFFSQKDLENPKKRETFASPPPSGTVKISEENLIKLETLFLDFWSILGIYGLVTVSNFYSERFSKKIKLSLNYEPNQIFSFYKLRPEKIIIRSSQIFFEIFRFLLFYSTDNFFSSGKIPFFPKKKEKNLKEKIENWVKKRNFYKINYLKTYKKTKKSEVFQGFRISNIFQIYELKNQKRKRINLEKEWDLKAKKLRKTIVNLSPAFVKIAQAFAARPDIVTERVANELQRLQDDMPFFSNDKAFEFIRTELGVSHLKIFSEISDSPVAAASLGQVYKGCLDGIPVAIKVQRPDLVELIALDMLIIRFFAGSFQKFLRGKTDLVASVDEYAERLFEELDYRREASNMIKFRSLYGYMDMIHIPRVFTVYSSQRVLVMDWVQGDRLVKNSVKVSQEDISLIETGVKCSLVQLLEIGFLHCDPHAGNLIKTQEGKLAYLDFGLVSEVPESVRFSFITAILHLINREYESLAKDFSGMALFRSDDLEREIKIFSLSLSEIFERSVSGSEYSTFQEIAEKIFRLSVRFPFILPPYFLNNLRALATLEGLGKIADSNFKIVNIIYPYIINRLLTNSSPQFQRALQKFLTNNTGCKPNWEKLEALLQDPEWTGTFSDRNQNLPDAFLNFIVSPSGSFVNRLIYKEVSEIFFSRPVLKNFLNIRMEFFRLFFRMNRKTPFNKSSFFFNNKKKKTSEIFQIVYFQSKIYNLQTLIFLVINCIQGFFFSFLQFLSKYLDF